MAVNAQVIDIRADHPRTSDALLVDSNVWLWMTYMGPAASAVPSADWRSRAYPDYVKLARRAKAKLFRCGLSMCELAHLIEQAEYEWFKQTHPNETAKGFRRNYPVERAEVAKSVQNAWQNVKHYSVPLDVTVDDRTTDAALANFHSQMLDG